MTSSSADSVSPRPAWQRPVPTIGDQTSAAERDDDLTGWAFDADTRAALDKVIGARRDIRRYRPDDVPDELVREVLNAGHGGPSVGHSQPWRFIVVRDARTRARAAWMADRERLRQANQLPAAQASRLLDLQLEGIREAPLGIVVACDRRTPPGAILGRNTFHDADLWSCACAIENMWLTARAAGLGMGWVTLMRPTELIDLLALPQGVETLGWMCLGWPDERPPYPGLERRAWSKKAPLDDVVLHESWPTRAPQPPASALVAVPAGHIEQETAPRQTASPSTASSVQENNPEPKQNSMTAQPAGHLKAASDSDTQARPIVARSATPSNEKDRTMPQPSGRFPIVTGPDSPLWSEVTAPSQRDVVRARDAADAILTPPGSLGKLDQALDRLTAVSPDLPLGGTLVLAGADHPIAALGVSAFDQSVTREVMEAAVAGQSLGALAAHSAGLQTVIVDCGVHGDPIADARQARPSEIRGDLANSAALTVTDLADLIAHGRQIGAEAAVGGIVCLGEVGVANTTVATALACVFTGVTPAEAAGIGAGSDSDMIAHKTSVISSALVRVDAEALRRDPERALAELGGPEFALLAGVVLGATESGAPVVLDGLATSVAALAVVEVNPAIQPYLIAGHASRETAHSAVLTELGLEPLLDLRVRAGEGVGACLAAQLLLTGLTVRRGAARTLPR